MVKQNYGAIESKRAGMTPTNSTVKAIKIVYPSLVVRKKSLIVLFLLDLLIVLLIGFSSLVVLLADAFILSLNSDKVNYLS